jgi:lysophospholipase L1-like esterase
VPSAGHRKTDDDNMSERTGEFDYSNLNPRPTGPFVRAAALALPGVRRVQAQVAPYAAAWRRSNQAALGGSGPLWVALGDSMTLGIGASAYDQGWVGQLGRQLSLDGEAYRIVNLAFSGARVTDVLDRQLPAMQHLDQRPALVTVLIGSNDATRKAYREALPSSYTLLLSRLPPGTVIAAFGGRQIAAQVSQLIEVAARQRGLIIADLRQGGPRSWRGRLADDHFHPNDLGYAGMARVFAAAIEGRRSAAA